MEIKSVGRYPAPNYPAQEDFLKNQENLFRKSLSSWSNKVLVLGTLITLVTGANYLGMGVVNESDEVYAKGKSVITNETIDKEAGKKPLKPLQEVTRKFALRLFPPIVAPIFNHGEGIGGIGCIVMTPPVFLCEEEARKIIEDELGKVGIKFDKHNFILPIEISEKVEETESNKRDRKTKKRKFTTKKYEYKIEFDGYSSSNKLVYEFVSSLENVNFNNTKVNNILESNLIIRHGTATDILTKQAALNLQKKLVNNKQVNVAIFYDPLPKFKFRFNDEKNMKTRQKIAANLLRAQVKDYINWLKKHERL
jgi:hypothetical protein